MWSRLAGVGQDPVTDSDQDGADGVAVPGAFWILGW